MQPGRRMKLEMMQKQRKSRPQPPTLEEALADCDCPESDKAEVRRFAAFLADSKLPLAEQIEKHGADYLGFTPAEVEAIRAAAALGEQHDR